MLSHQPSFCVTSPSPFPFFHLCSYPLTLLTSYFSCPLFLEMPRQPGISLHWAGHHKGGQVKLFYSNAEVQVLRHLILNFPAVCCGLSTGTEFRSALPLPPSSIFYCRQSKIRHITFYIIHRHIYISYDCDSDPCQPVREVTVADHNLRNGICLPNF